MSDLVRGEGFMTVPQLEQRGLRLGASKLRAVMTSTKDEAVGHRPLTAESRAPRVTHRGDAKHLCGFNVDRMRVGRSARRCRSGG